MNIDKPHHSAEYCPRQKTVEDMAALLDETSLIHVYGPRASGKSTLARQLADHLTAKNEPVIFVDK